MGGNRYNDDMPTWSAVKAHMEKDEIHPRNAGGGTLPSGTENQTIRKSASAWEATDVLKTHTDGAEITTDHPLGTTARVVMVVAIEYGDLVPIASGYPYGTFLSISKKVT